MQYISCQVNVYTPGRFTAPVTYTMIVSAGAAVDFVAGFGGGVAAGDASLTGNVAAAFTVSCLPRPVKLPAATSAIATITPTDAAATPRCSRAVPATVFAHSPIFMSFPPFRRE